MGGGVCFSKSEGIVWRRWRGGSDYFYTGMRHCGEIVLVMAEGEGCGAAVGGDSFFPPFHSLFVVSRGRPTRRGLGNDETGLWRFSSSPRTFRARDRRGIEG